jgi:hypothetical protein
MQMEKLLLYPAADIGGGGLFSSEGVTVVLLHLLFLSDSTIWIAFSHF